MRTTMKSNTMKNKTHKFVLLLLTILSSTGINAQSVVVTLVNTTTESFSLAGIQSIKFGPGSMIIYELDGTITSWDIAQIDNYAFDGATSLNDQFKLENSTLTIFPNPATHLVNIQFTSSYNTSVTIDIIDANGKQIHHVYNGNHQGIQAYQWNSSVPKGIYYCRIVTDNKLITKPVIVQ